MVIGICSLIKCVEDIVGIGIKSLMFHEFHYIFSSFFFEFK